MWFHFVAEQKLRRLNRGKVAECLKSKHGIKTVGDVELLAKKLDLQAHLESDKCECTRCMEIGNKVDYLHPQSYVDRARQMVNTLQNK